MARHIFLTGEKQVGKSTLIKRAIAHYSGNIGGFLTVRTNQYFGDRYSVHLLCVGGDAVPNESNLLFACGQPNLHISERFDRLGCEALSRCAGASLIVMDELGPHEAEAALFRRTVLKRLDGDVPVLGVLQAPAELFWTEIVDHPEVEILKISPSNREDALLRIEEFIRQIEPIQS